MASRIEPFAFTFLGRRLRFAWDPAGRHRRAFHFVDIAHARQFLDALKESGAVGHLLRWLVLVSPHEQPAQDEELVDFLALHLARRTLAVVDDGLDARSGGGKVAPVQPPPFVPPPPTAPTTFIEVELVDADGRPVPHQRYRITLPDGSVRNGRLDARGTARIEGIRPAGPCDVEFPDIHGPEWH